VNALIRAELLKLCTRTHAGVLLVTMAFVPLAVASEIPRRGKGGTALSLDDPGLFALAVGTGFVIPVLFAALLGGVAVTQEYRYGTVTTTYLVEPRRHRVLAAKCVALAVAGAVATTVTLLISVPFAAVMIGSRGGAVPVGARFWETVAAGLAVMVWYAVVGVLVGALLRNQVAFVVAVLAWMLAVEHLVYPAYPSIGRWMPGPATYVLMQLNPSADPHGQLLSMTASEVLLAAYGALALVLALRLTPRRDVL
jgi:ABC-type transport system involved in multi-copper enzyme maturation permease subunit